MSETKRKNWPDEKKLAEIRERLSSNEIMGSTVLDASAPLVDRIKANICSKIIQYQLETQITQKDLAVKLHVDEPEMSRIIHYKLERYSIDRLLGYLEILYPNLKFEVIAA